jgi:Protein of unknown function (DUF3168)
VLTVTGSPALPFADAIRAALLADATLQALVPSGILSALPRATRTTMPYQIIGRRGFDDQGGAMQLEGGHATVFIDTWSDHNGPSEVQQIQARNRVLLQRQPLAVSGFVLIAGSLTCAEELVFVDFDADMPERTLFHGVQEWRAWLEEAI